MSSSTDIDVGNPRRPFSEQSAKVLYRALKDVEAAMNWEELKTLRVCQQMPLQAMEVRIWTEEVKDLMLQTEVDLGAVKAWLFARNEMATTDPESVDLEDPDVATEMIVESTRVVDEVTALAEKWEELALRPWKGNLQTANWVIKVAKIVLKRTVPEARLLYR